MLKECWFPLNSAKVFLSCVILLLHKKNNFLLAIAILFERKDKKHTEPSAKKALQLKNISKYVICY